MTTTISAPSTTPSTSTATSTMSTRAARRGRVALARFLTTATAETAVGQRVRGLLGELTEIASDRQLAGRYCEPGSWLEELADEERGVWEHIVEALTPVSSANISANIKEEQ